MTIDNAVQLHEVIEIHYYADHYEAQLYTQDGRRKVLIGSGSTVQDAMIHLDQQLDRFNSLADIRKLHEGSWEKS